MRRIRKELASLKPRAKDQRTLIASSNAVTSSTTSPGDPADIAPDHSGSSKESGWRTAYEAAKMAIEIAKESSDMFPPLKAVAGVLSVLVKNYDKTTANAEQIRDIEERVQSLGDVLASPVGDEDGNEKTRREALRMKLAEIISRLEPLSEQHGITKFLKNADYANTLDGFVQDLAYAITDYQTSIQQNIYENTRNIIEAADLELLGKLNPVINAGYQAGHHDTCLRGTRESVLDGIMRWAQDSQDRHVFWLNGLAGTGKSTIAQTFSEIVAQNRTLGASFFCSRDYVDRKELKNIFPTLAYQLACRYPSFRAKIVRVIRQDPSVAQNSLISQLKELIVDPLSSAAVSCVIVVDALDECVDDQAASAFLSVLGRYVKHIPSVKFFITGRPEPRIRTGFRLPLLDPFTQIFLLHEVEPSSVNEDIRVYLREKLTAIAKRRSNLDLSSPWPCDEDLTALTRKSSGLFIFASTLVKFIESEHHDPGERLRRMVSPQDSTIHEGRAGIDPLYAQVLTHAFLNVTDTFVFTNLRRVLSAAVLAFNPLSRVQIAEILGINQPTITATLRHLHSVILVPDEYFKEIRVFHKSFPDFLQDRSRCSDSRFFIDPPIHHGDLALGCLELLKRLKPNPCNLPPFVMNWEVGDLQELLEEKVGSAMRYACVHWTMHVRSSPITGDYAARLIASATEFLENNVVQWIEVMSLENQVEGLIHSIYNIFDWIAMVYAPTSVLRNLAEDCLRFTMRFFHLIQQSAPHVHHSALPLSPRMSKFRTMIHRENTLITELHGYPDTWGVVVRTIEKDPHRFSCMTVFGYFVAAAYNDHTAVIYNTITGSPKLSLSPADPIQAMRGFRDGSMLCCKHRGPSITLWDIQTGGLIDTFTLEQEGDLAVSLRGRYLAHGSTSDGSVTIWEVTSRRGRVVIAGNGWFVSHLCWLEPEERLAVARGASVCVWDVVSGAALSTFKTWDAVRGVAYSQALNVWAVVTAAKGGSDVTIIDPKSDVSPTPCRIQQQLSCPAFSRTTKDLICCAETGGLELLNTSTRSWRHFDYPAAMTNVSTLPNGLVVAEVVGSGIQLFNLEEGYAPSQAYTLSALFVGAFDEGKVVAVLPTARDEIVFVESSTMLQAFKIPTGFHGAASDKRKGFKSSPRTLPTIPVDLSSIVCVSLEHRTAALFQGEDKPCLLLCSRRHEWTLHLITLDEWPLIGGISPSGARLVTIDSCSIHLWDTQNGQLRTRLDINQFGNTDPLGIKFESEDEFHSQHGDYRVPYVILPSVSGTVDDSIIRRAEIPSVVQPQRRYDVDEAREWVTITSSPTSTKAFWIPLGYIRLDHRSHCWIGNTLAMAGLDGTLRKLTFREPL